MRRWDAPAPDERVAGDRSWEVVREAYEERIRVPRKRDWRPVAIVAVAAAVVAAAVTPPGHAVLGSLRDAVRGERNASPALVSLPTPHSRLLVKSAAGTWVVQSDSSKRLLRGYHDASWSPHGIYIAAVRGYELRAFARARRPEERERRRGRARRRPTHGATRATGTSRWRG